MIGTTPQKGLWSLAGALSMALHSAALAAVIWRPSFQFTADPPPTTMQIDVSALQPSPEVSAPVLTTEALPGPDLTAVQTPASPQVQPSAEEPQVLTSLLDPSRDLPALPQARPDIIDNGGETPAPDPQQPAVDSQAEADPRLVELFQRIRNQLTEPCLLALPAMRGEDELQLGVLAASDRQISALMRDLTEGLSTPVTQAATLIDQRQCPAISFARNDARYPVFGLGFQLEAQDIASGNALRGRISGSTGYYTTLLMIDDNGTVHDLRRFLISSAGTTNFDVPVARMGAARDTNQILLALATPTRPQTVAQRAGELAEPFFAALEAELGPEAMIGITSIYVR